MKADLGQIMTEILEEMEILINQMGTLVTVPLLREDIGKNNQNAAKLVEKYNDLAREALSNGDKILSENYLQHSEHFSRIMISQEISRNHSEDSTETNVSNQIKVETENKQTEESK